MNVVRLWKKKPLEVQVVQWDGNLPTAQTLIIWVLNNGGTARYIHRGEPHFLRRTDELEVGPDGDIVPIPLAPSFIVLDTSRGAQRNDPEDFTVFNPKGYFYVCSPDIFVQDYERAT